MGPTQKAVLRLLAERSDSRGTVGELAIELDMTASEVHAALARLVTEDMALRSLDRGYYVYTLTPLGERMAEELGEGS